MLRRTASIAALVLILAACSAQPAQNAALPDDASPAQKTAREEAPSFVSKVRDIRIGSVSALPAHKGAVESTGCDGFVQPPKSAAARAVRDAGWAVTGEGKAGGYDAVSFVGGFAPGTSGTCVLEDGNIAFFKDGAIKAIAYGRQSDGRAIGLVAIENGRLKIHDGDFLQELAAQIAVADDGSVTIEPLANAEKACGGAASLPNIQGMPIDKARERLIAAGWKPARRAEPLREIEDGRAYALAQAGVSEVDGCSGTGMGYCSFAYTGPGGRLSVVTVGDGEWPTVSRYGVECD